MLEHGADPDEVNEDGLAVAAVAAIAWVLRHVSIDHHTVGWRMAEPSRLVCLHLAEGPPAAWGARNVLMHRSLDIGEHRSATRAWPGFSGGLDPAAALLDSRKRILTS